jgi:WD40 repeat protein
MKKILGIVVLSLLISVNANTEKQDMISALKTIPGVADASWAQDISLWVVMTNPNAGHNFDQMGSMICNGGVSNFAVSKGYTITFWNPYTKKPIKKFRCY